MSLHLVEDPETERILKEHIAQKHRERQELLNKKKTNIKRLKMVGCAMMILFSPIIGGVTYSIANFLFGIEALSYIQGVVAGMTSIMIGTMSLISLVDG